MFKSMMLFIFLIFLTSTLFGGISPSGQYLINTLNGTNSSLDKNQKRMSTGRILLTDDPANNAIYEKLEAQIRGLDKLIGNDQDMLNYYQYMDGVYATIISNLQRIRELSVRSMNGILTDEDKSIIYNEMNQYYNHIKFTLKTSEFNRIKVFSKLMNDPAFEHHFQQKKFYNLKNIDRLLKFILKQRTNGGAIMNRLSHQIRGRMINKENTAKAQSKYDTNFAKEMTLFKMNQAKMMINIFMIKHKIQMDKNKSEMIYR